MRLPSALRGRLTLDEDGSLSAATLSTLRVSPGDDARVEFRKEGSVHRLTVRGQVLDARPMLRNLTSGGPPSRRGEDKAPDIELDLAVPIFTGFNGEAIGNAAIKLSRRGGEVRQLEATGRIGRAGLQIRQAREGEQRVMRVRSEDAGGFLRFFDLYRRAVSAAISRSTRSSRASAYPARSP